MSKFQSTQPNTERSFLSPPPFNLLRALVHLVIPTWLLVVMVGLAICSARYSGSLDAPIVGLIDFINSLSDYYTTSSCSGRISIFQHALGRRKGGRWLLIKHEPATQQEMDEALNKIERGTLENDSVAASSSSSSSSLRTDPALPCCGDVLFRFEPFILSVECSSLSAASRLLVLAQNSGFRESGFSAANKRFIVSVRSSVRLEVPLYSAEMEADRRKDKHNNGSVSVSDRGGMLVDDSYLHYLLRLANDKFDVNFAKIHRFEEALRKEQTDSHDGGETKQKRKRHYSPFDAANDHDSSVHANDNASSSSSNVASRNQVSVVVPVAPVSSRPRPKMSAHALHGRQQRLLDQLGKLEARLGRCDDLIQNAIRNASHTFTRHHGMQPTTMRQSMQDGTSVSLVNASSIAPVSLHKLASPPSTSSSSSNHAASSTPVDVLLVPRPATKLVKDACTARNWLDVSLRIQTIPSSTLPPSIAKEHVHDTHISWMALPIIHAAVQTCREWLHAAGVSDDLQPLPKHRATLWKHLTPDSTPSPDDMTPLYICSLILPNGKRSAPSAPARSSISSHVTTRPLQPSDPQRVRLAHMVAPLLAAQGIDATSAQGQTLLDALPHKWEQLGDMLLLPPTAFHEAAWAPLRQSSQPHHLAPLWSATLSAFTGVHVHRIGIQRAVTVGDVLRSAQIEVVVDGSEIDHPHRDEVASRRNFAWQHGKTGNGWVAHRESGVTFHLDVTRVMFSSGNGNEKARLLRLVQTMNLAKLAGDTQGETIVDLYAGIGYFTLPLLVHTAPNKKQSTSSSSSTSSPVADSDSTAAAAASSSTSTSTLHFLHACEWNPASLEALELNMLANHIDTSRFTIHAGDNRRVELGQKLEGVADRVLLGLLPSSEDAWPVAIRVLKSRGGMMHVHACLPAATAEEWARSTLLQRLRSLLPTSGGAKSHWQLFVNHVQVVKNYAPRIVHVVIDVAAFPPDAPFWTSSICMCSKHKHKHEQQQQLLPSTPSVRVSAVETIPEKPTSPTPTPTPATSPSDPSHWYPFSMNIRRVHQPTHAAFRQLVLDQRPVLLTGLDLGDGWREAFTPESMLQLATTATTATTSESRARTNGATTRSSNNPNNPIVSVHVAPQSSRMDFLHRNYMFKQMRMDEMIKRMMVIGREEVEGGGRSGAGTGKDSQQNGTAPSATSLPRSAESRPSTCSSSSSTISRDSYFVSPHEKYYLRALGSNPKHEVAHLSQGFPALAKHLHLPPRAAHADCEDTEVQSTQQSGTGLTPLPLPCPLVHPSRVFSSVLRVSSPGIQLWSHYDIHDNILIHLHGWKRVVLFPPECATDLQIKPIPDSSSSPILDIDQMQMQMQINMNKTNGTGAEQQADPMQPSFARAQRCAIQVLLRPGDALFIPALWFHNVTTLHRRYAREYEELIRNADVIARDAGTAGAATVGADSAAVASHPSSSSSIAAPTSSTPPSPSLDASLHSDVSVSVNIFWQELDPSIFYAEKDVYGNKDIKQGSAILQLSQQLHRTLTSIPAPYARFYGTRSQHVIHHAYATRQARLQREEAMGHKPKTKPNSTSTSHHGEENNL